MTGSEWNHLPILSRVAFVMALGSKSEQKKAPEVSAFAHADGDPRKRSNAQTLGNIGGRPDFSFTCLGGKVAKITKPAPFFAPARRNRAYIGSRQ